MRPKRAKKRPSLGLREGNARAREDVAIDGADDGEQHDAERTEAPADPIVRSATAAPTRSVAAISGTVSTCMYARFAPTYSAITTVMPSISARGRLRSGFLSLHRPRS